ncbi:MAG: hypothetical protein EOO48_05540 [Flavobacterium sp.]|nr:MAG: hypothetical protein EOO48_05540 [Flavobacterium sp.]
MKLILSVLTFVFLSFPIRAQNHFEVFFDFNKDEPNKNSSAMITEWIKSNPKAEVVKIAGYCDTVDTGDYNIELSSRRIQSLMKTLKANNIQISETVELKAYGENFKQSLNDAQNRRVDVFFKPADVTIAKNGDNRKREEVFRPDAPEAGLATKIKSAKAGDLIRINDINFFLNSEVVVPESEPRLDELYYIMRKNPKLVIEIRGHICCNPDVNDTKLSYRRAKYIFSYLLEKGIPLNRLAYRGFGSARPIYRIPEKTANEQAANRRVELFIIAI